MEATESPLKRTANQIIVVVWVFAVLCCYWLSFLGDFKERLLGSLGRYPAVKELLGKFL